MAGQGDAQQELARELEQLRERVAILERVDAERQALAEELREETLVSAALQRIVALPSADLDTKDLVQAITDEVTALTGAEFGAYFYNVVGDSGESYTLYTLSGVDPEAFASFPMPRKTEIFGPTFRGEDVLRLDDVTLDPRFGKNPPYDGMPEGHLPVHSYLAVPVIARDGEVLGGLFLGHSRPAVFTERDEQLVVAIVAHAAAAIEHGRLLREAQAAKAQHRNLFDGIADAILMADENSRYVDANPAAEKLLGYSRAELLNLSVADIVAYQPTWTDAEWQRFRQDGVWTGEVELRHKDGQIVPVEAHASTVELPDGVVFASVLRDISQRRNVEKMQREFTTLITHELKAPLTSLKGFTQLLQRRQEYDPGAIEVILGRTNHLERLISDLLDVASADSGKLSLRRADVDLVTIVGRNVEMARATTTEHQIQISAPSQPIVGWWDSGRLSQVLQNLLSNAIKYSPTGGNIVVSLDADDRNARVSIADSGVGISAGSLPHVFDRFYRVEGVEHASVQGLGIGLYIVRTLIEAHGGDIFVESTPDQGSTFTISLPRSS